MDEEGFSWLYIPLIRAALYMDGQDATYHAFVLVQANGYDSDAWVQFFRDRFTLLGYTIRQVPISTVAVGYIDPMYQVILLEPESYAGYADMIEFYKLIRQQTRVSISSSVPEEVVGVVDDVRGVSCVVIVSIIITLRLYYHFI